MDEDTVDVVGAKSPIKRLGSTRKLIYFNNIKMQLTEQLRCLDTRMETQITIVNDLQDYFKKRAELEMDYSKNLEKLVKGLNVRQKEHRLKREQISYFPSYSCWIKLLQYTRNLSKDHAALSDIYSVHLSAKLSEITEDVQRVYKRCKEIGDEMHAEIVKVLNELNAALKTFQQYQEMCKQAESKLRLAESQRNKVEQSIPKEKLDRSKKFKMCEKEVQKRKNKYFDVKLKTLKARNEYMLCIESSNTTLNKYYVEDISDLIDFMDFGYYECVTNALRMYIVSEETRGNSIHSRIATLKCALNSLDSRLDKQKFCELNHSAFMVPKKLEFQGNKDEIEPELQKLLFPEIETRIQQLLDTMGKVQTESDEVYKTMLTTEKTLVDMFNSNEFNCKQYFNDEGTLIPKPPETIALKIRADRQETEEFYMTKLRDYILGTSRNARLNAKYEFLSGIVKELSANINVEPPGNNILIKPVKRKRFGRSNSVQPKLFGGSLEEYIDPITMEIPLIIRSCVRLINLYGLHHQGVFRVSGSQVEINHFKDAFERGEDPLADMTDASDINSVAGVLKLYFRELREPLFPMIYFEQFMDFAQLISKSDFINKMRDFVQSLPRCIVVVMRYLFSFLNHLSEYSDENMMDPYNLAICFGPTLIPVPDDKDQVQYQNHVNELIKNIIMYHDEIFIGDYEGTIYEKYILKEHEIDFVGDSPTEVTQEEDSEVYPSEDESDRLDAVACFDFTARSSKELNLIKGDLITLYNQVSSDWWRGSVNGKDGLIPNKYISLKLKDCESEKEDLACAVTVHTPPEVCPNSTSSADFSFSDSNSTLVHSTPWISQHQVNGKCQSLECGLNILDELQTEKSRHEKFKTHVKSKSFSDPITEPPDGFKDNEERTESLNNPIPDETDNFHNETGGVTKLIHTPDLVMDLPLNKTNEKINTPELSSPDVSIAERFANQDQSTLKKNTKVNKVIDDLPKSPKPIQAKPLNKTKPPIMKKPILPSCNSPLSLRKNNFN